MTDATITAVEVMTIQAQLPAPVIFGEWIMRSASSRWCGCAPTGAWTA